MKRAIRILASIHLLLGTAACDESSEFDWSVTLEEAAAPLLPASPKDCGTVLIAECLCPAPMYDCPVATPQQQEAFDCLLEAGRLCKPATIRVEIPTIDSGPVISLVAVVPDADGCHYLTAKDNRSDKYALGGFWYHQCSEAASPCHPVDFNSDPYGCEWAPIE